MGLLYTDKKIFHYTDKIDSLPRETGRILPPLHIRIKPTNACNHNCSYCAYRSDDLQLGKDMDVRDSIPREKMMEILDDVIEMGVKAVTFSGGGEPFCYPHLLDCVKKLAASPVKFASLTNGARLTGEVAEVFAHHATWLRVSMDGWDDKSYMEYRRCPDGEFSRIVENMRSFKKMSNHCYLGVSLIVDRKNAAHVYDTISCMKDIGVDSVKISPCVVSNLGSENDAYHGTIFDSVKEQAQEALSTLAGEGFEVFDSYHALDEKFAKEYQWCPYLQVLTVIGADQKVYSCQDKAYNLAEGLIGSIESRRFKDFWFTDKEKFFCVNPSQVCNHHCVSNHKNKMLLEYLEADREHLGFV
ncbi:radical SAM protein [Citrifermentans bremense]|uniref:radical SAM protein n=1 Tax=Citrifermentans bremense TaxID=60035 RepID=UPI000426684E|nr:radical SAM protein [Citrifermentans bremense]